MSPGKATSGSIGEWSRFWTKKSSAAAATAA
jgi:hypothetical protein